MIACFLSNISAKYYRNPSLLSRVIAKNVGYVFLRHSVYKTEKMVCWNFTKFITTVRCRWDEDELIRFRGQEVKG